MSPLAGGNPELPSDRYRLDPPLLANLLSYPVTLFTSFEY